MLSTLPRNPYACNVEPRSFKLASPFRPRWTRWILSTTYWFHTRLPSCSTKPTPAPTQDDDGYLRSIVGLPRGHKYWGLTIYRCTYNDDAAWAAFTEHILANTARSLEAYGAEELTKSLKLDIRDDAAIWDCASKDRVREHFKQWISDPETARVEMDGQLDDGPFLIDSLGNASRYQFCIHMDEDALYSIIDRETQLPKEHAGLDGYVNTVNANWRLPSEEDQAYLRKEFDTDDALDEGYEPIEGCKMRDVGWMRVAVDGLMPIILTPTCFSFGRRGGATRGRLLSFCTDYPFVLKGVQFAPCWEPV